MSKIQGCRGLRSLRAVGVVTLPLLTAGLFALLLGCRTRPDRNASGDAGTSHILSELQDDASGFSVNGIQTYSGERLYDYMNGAAVTYFDHHFRTLAVCDVRRGGDQAKVELYAFASPSDASALYREFCSSAQEILPAGRHGAYWMGFEPEGLFLRDRYLVRVYGYAKTEAAGRALVFDVSRALDAILRQRFFH